MTMSMGFGLGGDGLKYDLCEDSLRRINVQESDLELLLSDFVEEYQKYEALFEEMSRD
jgi:hypothetical protein